MPFPLKLTTALMDIHILSIKSTVSEQPSGISVMCTGVMFTGGAAAGATVQAALRGHRPGHSCAGGEIAGSVPECSGHIVQVSVVTGSRRLLLRATPRCNYAHQAHFPQRPSS